MSSYIRPRPRRRVAATRVSSVSPCYTVRRQRTPDGRDNFQENSRPPPALPIFSSKHPQKYFSEIRN